MSIDENRSRPAPSSSPREQLAADFEQPEPAGVETDPLRFAGSLAELAAEWRASGDPDATERRDLDRLQEIVAGAVGVVPGCEHVALVHYDRNRQLVALATSGPETAPMIALQNELAEGPCRETAATHTVMRAASVPTDRRWRRFAPRAAELGIGSMLCMPLLVGDRSYGSLSMASSVPNAFTEESEILAAVFATHAAIALADAKRVSTLMQALDTRDVIGQAKGVLMARYAITADQAFSALVRESKKTNTKLRTVAERVSAELTGPSSLGLPTRSAAAG